MDRGPRHIVALVEQLQQAADACPERWGTEAGPADRAALDLFCLLALRSGSTVLNLLVEVFDVFTGLVEFLRGLLRLLVEPVDPG
ncbi:hypothetical protein ABZ070_33185, partial [Streptomyces sp. NPDC006283]|uniref:hypothetical protein n=1 Tax=Streptomyces sp. NPDC006283 TaxID=3156741 RepID=UPI0033A8CED7